MARGHEGRGRGQQREYGSIAVRWQHKRQATHNAPNQAQRSNILQWNRITIRGGSGRGKRGGSRRGNRRGRKRESKGADVVEEKRATKGAAPEGEKRVESRRGSWELDKEGSKNRDLCEEQDRVKSRAGCRVGSWRRNERREKGGRCSVAVWAGCWVGFSEQKKDQGSGDKNRHEVGGRR